MILIVFVLGEPNPTIRLRGRPRGRLPKALYECIRPIWGSKIAPFCGPMALSTTVVLVACLGLLYVAARAGMFKSRRGGLRKQNR